MKDSKKTAVIGVVAVLVLLLLAGGAYMMSQQDGADNSRKSNNVQTEDDSGVFKKPENEEEIVFGEADESKYELIQNDMTYEEVVEIMGGEGLRTFSMKTTVVSQKYEWEYKENEENKKVEVTFADNKVTAKRVLTPEDLDPKVDLNEGTELES